MLFSQKPQTSIVYIQWVVKSLLPVSITGSARKTLRLPRCLRRGFFTTRKSNFATEPPTAPGVGPASPPPRQQGVDEPEAHTASPRWSWAQLLKRVFALDMARCPWCPQGTLRIIAVITQGEAIRKRACVMRGKGAPMKYFLTGATGFVGGKVAAQLCAQGHDVIALVRTPAKAQALTQLGVQLAPGDIMDKESMRAPMRGVDGVYHIAGWYKIGTPDTAQGLRINVEGTRHVLTLMQELAIPKGVYTSTLAVNSDTHGQEVDERYRFTGRHLSVYDASKWRAHYEVAEPLMAQGLPLVIVQPGLIYGPGDQGPSREIFVQYLQRTLPMLPQRTAYSWTHVADVAEAHIAAMEQGHVGESYMICGPSHTLHEAMQIAARITGVAPPRLTAPPWLLRGLSGLMGVMERVVPVPPTFTREFLRVSAGVTYLGTHAKATAALGYSPRALETGLRETLPLLMHALGMPSSR